ncbi:phage major capsid protein [Sulfitobacter sp. 1A16787]|uniref:phage major capsid protein n=1 Tax=Sulfitobacter sp. 1A16787 TaxID=3368571 RepID=UPI003746D6C8
MTPKELRAKKAQMIVEARAKLGEITDKMSAEERGAIEAVADGIITEAEGLERQAERLERMSNLEAGLEERSQRRPDLPDDEQRNAPETSSVTYREAFHQAMRNAGQIQGLTPEVRAALSQGITHIDPEQRAQTAGTGSAGGFLVPDEMMRSLVKAMAAWGPMYDDDFCMVINTSGGGTIPIPGVDDTGKRAAKNTSEGAKLGDTGSKDAVFTRTTLGEFMYDTEWLRLSLQFLTGSFENAEAVMNGLLAERLGRTTNAVLTTGSGSGEPLGIVTGATAGPAATAAAQIAADDILALYHAIDPAYRGSPKFRAQFNDNTLLALHKMKDGDGNYLLRNAPDGSGRLTVGAVSVPYAINQEMADIGASARSMIMGDHSRYFVRKVGGPVIGTSQDSNFWPNMGIAGYARIDGALADAKAIKALVHPAS